MADRIEKRLDLPMGMRSDPEALRELEERRALHARKISGKPERTFGDVLDEKMHGKKKDQEDKEEQEKEPEKGAIDPHMGLSPGQSPELAKGGKGRRAGRVIVKG